MSDLTGEVIDGRYKLNRIVASGGMATIYAATDLRLDRSIAVKIMHPHLAQDEKFVERFIREAKAAAALSHPNIVSVLDQGWNQGGTPCVFIVMELVEGATLRDYMFEQGPATISNALQMIIPVASALSAAHRLGIVHRDIKPENILVSNEGRIKIADFGLARGALLGTTMTAESSVILGSVSYLSPEQVQRGVADARSDIYSLGIVLFELLTGQKPYQGDDPVQIAIRHVNERVPAPSSVNPGIPIEVDDLVLRATDIDPDKRPADGAALLEELRKLSEKIDPRKRQLSLELDLPPAPLREPVKERERKRKSSEAKSTPKESENEVNRENTGKTKRVSNRVRRNRRIAVTLLISLIGIGWYAFAGPGSKIVVPSLAGSTVKEAREVLSNLGLTLKLGTEEFNEDIPEGRIIKSDPAGGGRVDEGGEVTVFTSKGKERILIPNLIGLTPESAQKLLEENNLVVSEITEEFSSEIANGLVMRSSPAEGERVKPESNVIIIISKGVEKLEIVDYKGKSGEQALNELSENGFEVDTKYVFSEDLPAGAVVSQSPNAGAADKGSQITLLVSKGTEFVFIPNVFGLSEIKAVTALEDQNLRVNVKKVGTKKEKFVTNISPKVGTKVKRGSKVTITVG
ncbi:MAG: Stk1 family PASTA domain-containing Ser/Thr kinase [Candidatus Nanopelagicaceae bacterium]